MKKISFKIRFPKKLLLSLAGLLLVGGAGAGAAVYLGYLPLGKMPAGHDDAVEVSGVACTTLDMIKLQRNGQRWLRKIVTTEGADGVERVRTALRVAGVMAKSEKADLYQVMVLDHAGPTSRAERRGPAIGAEVLFAPHPDRLPSMSAPFEARYINADANEAGLFIGQEVVLSPDDVRAALTAMTDRTDCADPNAAVAAADAAEGHGGGHAKPAEGHGEAAAEGHEAAPAEGHGEPAAEGHDSATAEGHGAPAEGEASAAEGGHEAPGGEKPGFLSSMLSMIPGLGGSDKPAPEAAHAPASAAEGAHPPAEGAASAAHAGEGDEMPAGSPPAAEKGLLSSLMEKIPFIGGDKADDAASEHPPVEHQVVGDPAHTAPAANPPITPVHPAETAASPHGPAAPESADAHQAAATPQGELSPEAADVDAAQAPPHAATAEHPVTVPSDATDKAETQAEAAPATPADLPAQDPHSTAATH
ncbi:hypothetical protein ACLE20_07335 [Rhizobium sp. YIM 134829]|uniref:hypothetical protein n=1 Tax=Rhizobium sp. YIM 134829 TaxID=3390453 RepID=UPI00397A0F79